MDLFTRPTSPSANNKIIPVIRDNLMHWLKFLFVLLFNCSTFQLFLFFSSPFSYQVSFSVYFFSGWHVCHYSTSDSDILSHLRLVIPLHQVPSVSVRCSHRSNQLFFVVAVDAISGSSFLLPSPPARFIVGWLLHPCCCDWPYFSFAFIYTVLHSCLIFASSPELDISFLLPCRLSCQNSAPLVFALLCSCLSLRLLISPFLLLPSPPLGARYYWYPLSADCFAIDSASAYKDAVSRGLPYFPPPDSSLRLRFWRYKYVASRSLPGFFSRLTSPGSALRGPGLGGRPTLSSYWLSFPVASLRIEFLTYITLGIIQLLR